MLVVFKQYIYHLLTWQIQLKHVAFKRYSGYIGPDTRVRVSIHVSGQIKREVLWCHISVIGAFRLRRRCVVCYGNIVLFPGDSSSRVRTLGGANKRELSAINNSNWISNQRCWIRLDWFTNSDFINYQYMYYLIICTQTNNLCAFWLKVPGIFL